MYRSCIFQCISLKLIEVIWRAHLLLGVGRLLLPRKFVSFSSAFHTSCIQVLNPACIDNCQQGFVNRMKLAVRSLCSLLCPPLLIKRTGVNC